MKRWLAIVALLLIAFSVSAKEIPDVDVVDQSGRPLHFYRDLVAQKSSSSLSSSRNARTPARSSPTRSCTSKLPSANASGAMSR